MIGRAAVLRIIVLAILLCVVYFAFNPPFDPHSVDLQNTFAGLSADHWLGTDHLGRDLAARLLVGSKPSLFAIAIVLAGSLGIGITAGAVIAFGPTGPSVVVRWLAQTLLAVPTLILALVIAAFLGAGTLAIALALIVSAWAPYALTIAALFERLTGEDYWRASLALGASVPGAIRRHLLPNAWHAIGALAGADAGRAVIVVSSLGFIGLSADTGLPEWGAMIHEYRAFLFSEPRLVMTPLLSVTVLSAMLHLFLDSREQTLVRRHLVSTSKQKPSRH